MEDHTEIVSAPEHDLLEETHDEYWEKECMLHPDHPGCKNYED